MYDKRQQLIENRGFDPNIKGRQYDIYLSNFKVSANYLARRIGDKRKTIAELCCSIGSTTVELAKNFKKVIGVDIDKKVLTSNRQNLEKAGVGQNVELLEGDVSDAGLLKRINADIVIYDIPYWVPKKFETGELNLDKNPDLKDLVTKIRKYITHNIIIFAPPRTTYDEITKLLGECEFQMIIVNGRHDRNYIYFGDTMNTKGITKKELKL